MTRPVQTERAVPNLRKHHQVEPQDAAALMSLLDEGGGQAMHTRGARSHQALVDQALQLQPSSGETARAQLPAQGRKLALVVDDNAINQLVANTLLNALGYEVALANNGVEAITACHLAPQDMVLMAIEMPLMDGYLTKPLDAQLLAYELHRLQLTW